MGPFRFQIETGGASVAQQTLGTPVLLGWSLDGETQKYVKLVTSCVEMTQPTLRLPRQTPGRVFGLRVVS